MLQDKEIDLVDIGIPNDLHCQVVLDAAKAGKHVIIEKPLCVTLEEADQMIEACQKGRRAADVCRRAAICPQVCAGQEADRRRRDRRAVPGEAVRGASWSAHALVLGCQPLRRRRAAGYGLPFDRIHALGAGQAQGEERDGLHGHLSSTRIAPKAKIILTPSSSTRATSWR